MMDKLEGNNLEAARADLIDFDYQSFKISCLHENGGKGIDVNEVWDGKVVLKNLRAQTQNRYKQFENDRGVAARVVKED
tara:strand:- start:1092 stop:1328 length:237 start_codon:yes stop_codon:yes gene_type:complete